MVKEILKVPVKGEVKDIKECSDIVFSQKMMGDGIMVLPSDNEIVAPCDGTIITVTESKHAITMCSDNGVELLIHIGIDTVEMEGKGFETFVKNGDKVKAGQKLMEVDMDLIKKEGYETSTMLVVLLDDIILEKLNLNTYVKEYVDVICCEIGK